jgi:hypothetical protein
MYEVKVYPLTSDKIPQVVRDTELLEDTGYYGFDSGNIMCIFKDGKLDKTYFDGGESEDNSFVRDWSWVKGALEDAYKFGKDANF